MRSKRRIANNEEAGGAITPSPTLPQFGEGSLNSRDLKVFTHETKDHVI